MIDISKFVRGAAFCGGLAAALVFGTSAVRADDALQPSAVLGNVSQYDGQTISVTGTAKDPQTRNGRRGTMTQYQLCDAKGSSCINVVQFGDASVKDGDPETVSGQFSKQVNRGHFNMSNVLLVGTPPSMGHQ